jgi:hypothetical protein
MVDRIELGETSAGPLAHYVRSINFNVIFVIVTIGFIMFAAIPLVVVAAKCA